MQILFSNVFFRSIAFSALVLLNALCLSSCQQPKQALTLTPIIDGNIDDFIELGVQPISISNDAELYIYQNEHYVWLAYAYPEGSWGTLDMQIETEKIKTPLNLHVSLQLGEWPLGNKELEPKVPESDLWWNISGWTSNPIWVNGKDTIDNAIQFKTKNAEAREIQLSKKRFGKGTWKFNMKINSIKGQDGKYYSIDFPEKDAFYILNAN